jgi:hypothetical protein
MEQAAFDEPSIPEARRAIILVDVTRVADSCGYGVPLMAYEGARQHHALSSAKKVRTMGVEEYHDFQARRGARSLDGLPALSPEPAAPPPSRP